MRRLLASICAMVAITSPAQALELRYGQSYIEQGDFLLHPGVQLSLIDASDRHYRLDFYGRRFGSFTEANGILGFDQNLDIFPWEDLIAVYGISVMDQYTARDSGPSKSSSKHSFNVGVNLGLHYKIYTYEKWSANVGWDSHIFAAGLAFILLTTARKSVFNFSVGYNL